MGIVQPTLANKLRLLTLTQAQQEFCVAQNLTERHARAVLRLPTEELRFKALKTAAQRGYTVQQTEAMVERVISARPKPKRKLMVKDVRIFVNTIEHALKVMTGSGIPATATRNESDEYIEYVVRIPARPLSRQHPEEKVSARNYEEMIPLCKEKDVVPKDEEPVSSKQKCEQAPHLLEHDSKEIMQKNNRQPSVQEEKINLQLGKTDKQMTDLLQKKTAIVLCAGKKEHEESTLDTGRRNEE